MKDINISYIRYFVTLADCKKFSRAASELHLSQPALSKSIRLLEEHIGTTLLKRYPKGFELTDTGEYFYKASVYFLKLYDEFLSDVDSKVSSPYSGTTRMSASGVVMDTFFSDVISILKKKYPEIKIYATQEDTNGAYHSLMDHKVDFATAITPLPAEASDKFNVHPLLKSTFYLVLHKYHPLVSKEFIEPEDLSGLDILTPGEASYIHKTFVSYCSQHSIVPKIVCACSQINFLFQLTQENIGAAVLPEVFLKSLPNDLEKRKISPEIPWELALIYPKTPLSRATKATLDITKGYFSSIEN